MKTLSEVLSILKHEKQTLEVRWSVKTLGIFGSIARNEQTPKSDVDILVEFSAPIGLDFVDLADYLESVLDNPVDVVSKKAITPDYWEVIGSEVVYV